MGSSHRMAAIAAASHARVYLNHTQPDVTHTEVPQYNVNILFISATLCGVLVAVCVACWRRNPIIDKPDEPACAGAGVYTLSADHHLTQIQDEPNGPPPAYDTVVDHDSGPKDCHLQEVVSEPCPRCQKPQRSDSGLPSYEAAVLLRDTSPYSRSRSPPLNRGLFNEFESWRMDFTDLNTEE